MTTNLFVIANVKQLRTGGSFRILLPFFRTSWGVGILNSAVFNSFHNQVEFGTILEDLRNLGGGESSNPPNPLGTSLIPTVVSRSKFNKNLLKQNVHDFCHSRFKRRAKRASKPSSKQASSFAFNAMNMDKVL